MSRTLLLDTPLYAIYVKDELGPRYINFLTGQYEFAEQPALRHLTDQRSLVEITRSGYCHPGIIVEFSLTQLDP